MITTEIRLDYRDRRTAEAVLNAVAPENGGYAEARIEGNSIIVTMSSEDPASLRRAADDLLACVKAAEASIGSAE